MVHKGPAAAAQQAAAQSAMNYEKISQDPMKHVVTFIEKKIRNLDKRKAKLDGYKRMVEDGKPLDPDQTAAASKYDEVIGSLEFAKDLMKSFEATTVEVMKQQRKMQRREQISREEADHNRVCFVIRASRIMELLHDNESMRDDFLNGSNGACVVSKPELDQIVNFYELFIVRTYDVGSNVLEDANAAGNHMYELAEGRSKDIVSTTYKDLNAVLGRISDCKYFEELLDADETALNNVAAGAEQNEEASVSSGSSGEDVEKEKPEEDEEEVDDGTELNDEHLDDNEASSPVSSQPASSSAYSGDEPLKTEEFLSSGDAAPPRSETWQQSAPETGGYLSPGVSYQFAAKQMTQRAYEAQRIQEVLAEVQGPCQFLQESIIEHEMNTSAPSVISFTGMDLNHLPQSLPTTVPSRVQQQMGVNLPPPAAHIHTSALELAFQTTQNVSHPIEQGRLSNVQQQLAPDVTPHVPSAISHPAEPALERMQDSRDHETAGYRSVTRQNQCYMPNATATVAQPGHPPPRQQVDNLGLGQTTFGGQQQTQSSPRLTYIHSSGEENSFSQDDTRAADSGYSSVSVDGPHSGVTSSVPRIPLPNDQQSGYRGFQGSDPPQNETKTVPVQDNGTPQGQHALGDSMDQLTSSAANKETSESVPASETTGAPGQGGSYTAQQQRGDHSSNYHSRNSGSGQQQHYTGRGRGGGYRSGPGNQGGNNYQQQRYNNYRGGRYGGSYDSMGRPNSNYSGGYQGNQSGGFRGHQDNYSGYRRGGGMRGGRGSQGRGNPRGGGSGNYNRSRTFRPQPSNEQVA